MLRTSLPSLRGGWKLLGLDMVLRRYDNYSVDMQFLSCCTIDSGYDHYVSLGRDITFVCVTTSRFSSRATGRHQVGEALSPPSEGGSPDDEPEAYQDGLCSPSQSRSRQECVRFQAAFPQRLDVADPDEFCVYSMRDFQGSGIKVDELRFHALNLVFQDIDGVGNVDFQSNVSARDVNEDLHYRRRHGAGWTGRARTESPAMARASGKQ